MNTDEYEKILWTEDVGEELLYDAVENLLAEVKRLKEREGTLLEIIASTETELNKYAKLYSEELE